MAEESQPQVKASGDGSVAIGGNVEHSRITAAVHHHHAPAPAPLPPRRLRSIPVAPMGAQFAGRRELLAELERVLLLPGAAASLSHAATVKADGGVGKTTLAAELGHRLFAEEKFDYVLFLNASSAADLDLDLSALCAPDKLNLPAQTAQDQATRLAGALAYLADPAHAARTLLLLDAADSDDAARRVRELHAQVAGCALLVTSRQALGGRIPEYRLDYFRPDEAREFLRQRLEQPPSANDTAASATASATATATSESNHLLDRIATALDHYPLALELAASQMREKLQTPHDWLDEWQSEAALIDTLPNPKHTDYPAPLSRVWERSFARLSANARKQLQLLAWLAPRPAALPLTPLKAMTDWKERRKWLAELEALSLIQRSPSATETGDEIFIHRVLQAVVRERVPEEEKAASRAAAVALLDAVIPSPEYNADGWRLWEQLKPHLQILLEHIKDTPQEPAALRWMNEFALWLYQRAQYAEPELLQRRGLTIAEKLYGPDHQEVATRLNNLVQLLLDTHRLAEAEPLLRRALAIAEASFGPSHPRIATHLDSLAHLLRATDRLAEAEPLLRRALAIAEASFGPHHPTVAKHLNNLAQLLKATRQLAEAEPLMRRSLVIAEASFGPDHPTVAIRLNNLATLLQATHRLAEAEPLMRRSLAIVETSFAPDHPTVATALNNLATLLQDTHRLAEAEPILRRALAIAEASFGPDHPTVAIRLNNLAHLLKATRRLAEAEPLLGRALAILLRAQFLTGHTLPNTAKFERNYRRLLRAMEWPAAQIDAQLAAMQREAAGEVDSR